MMIMMVVGGGRPVPDSEDLEDDQSVSAGVLLPTLGTYKTCKIHVENVMHIVES